MKKTIIALLISIFILIPTNASASQLWCDGDNKIQGTTFKCNIVLDLDFIERQTQFDKIQGTLTATSGITCKFTDFAESINKKETTTDTFMDLEGTPQANQIAEIECTVTENNPTTDKAQVFMNDFKYHIFNTATNDQSEILSSDYFTVEYKKDENSEEASGDKPRNTSNADSRLKSLTDENLKINFSQFYTEYSVEVLYDVDKLNIKAVPNNSDADVRIEGSQELEVGKNTIDIYVTSPDGTSVTCYTIYVKRLARGEEIYYSESDSSLSKLTVKGFTLSFDKETYEYKIHLSSKTDSVTVLTEATSPNSTINVSSTTGLKNGSVIVIEVTSADKTNKSTYKIHVTKDAAKKDYSQILIIIGIVVAIILVIVLFIYTNKKKDESDPLLSLKHKKRKMNKGKKFDNSQVEDITTVNPDQTTQLQETTQTQTEQVQAQVAPGINQQATTEPVQVAQVATQQTPIAPQQVVQQQVQTVAVEQPVTQQVTQPATQAPVQQVVPQQIQQATTQPVQQNVPAPVQTIPQVSVQTVNTGVQTNVNQ